MREEFPVGFASVRVSGRKQTHLFEKCALVADAKTEGVERG